MDGPLDGEDEWKILTSYISEKLDERADGNFLKEYKFWDDGRLEGLWEPTCEHCGEPCVTMDGLYDFFAGALDRIAFKDK
ncbi:hypothetical protein BD410DRAFT_529505 [Rickenella mellea]|uniref:Uncharacterized protein n=1 Tax=Rickenella mellea TaxID=50990 RepID=A0A4Y7QIG1_9AGAM|nr:hypothetical protein BD410DRAFT_529505 [Rickenella mellea]